MGGWLVGPPVVPPRGGGTGIPAGRGETGGPLPDALSLSLVLPLTSV